MNQPPAPEPRQRPFRSLSPVWAPDPAVPLAARILSYLFAVVLLLTVIRACSMPRPFDYPVLPTEWKSNTFHGVTLQSPANWQVISIPERDSVVMNDLLFYYTPPTREVLQMRVIILNCAITQASAEDIVKKLVDQYAPQAGNSEGMPANWHEFRGYPTRAKQAICGSWFAQISGNQSVLLLGFAPEDGWTVTQQTLCYMSDHLTIANDSGDDGAQ